MYFYKSISYIKKVDIYLKIYTLRYTKYIIMYNFLIIIYGS